MELVNNEYVKISKSDLFIEQVRASSIGNKSNLIFFKKVTKTLYDYERKNKTFIEELYIKTNSLCFRELSKTIQFPIQRQTLLNAMLFAIMNNQIDIALQLKSFVPRKNVYPNELGELLNYVLANSMDINEYFNGEKERIIYNDLENWFEKDYIFNNNKSNNVKKMELK